MRAVGIRELKNKLSEYLRLVRAGEELLVTDRGEVIAEVRPPGRSADDDLPPALRELARRGLVRIGAPNHADLYPRLGRCAPDGTAQRLLDAERGER
jgi:antitoxin (DNA-binding transcriptional repressor) of toxin-antitoxin stability system